MSDSARVKKSVKDSDITFYPDANVEITRRPDGSLKYVRYPHMDVKVIRNANGTTYKHFLHRDHLASVRVISNPDGNRVTGESTIYKAYGEPRDAETGNTP